MQFAVAALALAAGVSANYPVPSNGTQYTTAVITSTEIYCPGSTTLTYGTQTYEVTTPTTLTITDCSVTVVTPVYTTSAVVCHDCTYPTVATTVATTAPVPVYPTVHQNTTVATTTYKPTGGVTPPAPTYPAAPPTAAAGKVAAGMAGVLAALVAAL